MEKLRTSFGAVQVAACCQQILENACRNNPTAAAIGILDQDGQLLSVAGPNSLHYFSLGAVQQSIQALIKIPESEVWITNDPHCGNSRLCDLSLIYRPKLRSTAYPFILAAQLPFHDLLLAEDLRLPPSPLELNGQVNTQLLDFLSATAHSSLKTRLRHELDRCLVTLKEKARQLEHILSPLGRDGGKQVFSYLKKASAGALKRALDDLPDGEYTSQVSFDPDGFDEGFARIQCTIRVVDSHCHVSFVGSSKALKTSYNLNAALTTACVTSVLRALSEQPLAINSGVLEAFSLEAPPGTIVNNAVGPTLGGYYETSLRVVESLRLALQKAIPQTVTALHGGSYAPVVFRFPQSGRVFIHTAGCGAGGESRRPGADGIFCDLLNVPVLPIEVIEQEFPLQVIQRAIREGSGGDGIYRGGHGVVCGYKILESALVEFLGDRRQTKATGHQGGTSGAHAEILIPTKEGKRKAHIKKDRLALMAGDTVLVSTPGGGGWGAQSEA